jgi:hypothetical protein
MKPSLRLIIGLCVGGLLAFPLGLAIGRGLFARKTDPNTVATSNLLKIEGFDFSAFRAPENEWRGPNLGEKIDLSRLRTKEDKTLASVVGRRPFMLVAVNPTCGMCKIARDQMIYLRTELSRLNVDYYIVSFTSSADRQLDFFSYAESLKVGGQSFLWNLEDGTPSEAIFIMNNPSHLLLDQNGTVIRVWPGSYADKAVRDRMARQILADTSVVLETLNAVAPEKLRESQANAVKR